MRVGSLFTGVGGIELALPPHELVWMCEADTY
jgi:site-specific DNA-cytosine methylase